MTERQLDTWSGTCLTGTYGSAKDYKLIQHTVYPKAKKYYGWKSECTFEFKLLPEQIPLTRWTGEKVATVMADKVKDQGEEMLDLKIYEDTTPALWTNYKVIATCTEPKPAGEAVASPFPWAIVIPLILAILFIVALTFLIIQIKDLFVKAPVAGTLLAVAAVLGSGAALVAIAAGAKGGERKRVTTRAP